MMALENIRQNVLNAQRKADKEEKTKYDNLLNILNSLNENSSVNSINIAINLIDTGNSENVSVEKPNSSRFSCFSIFKKRMDYGQVITNTINNLRVLLNSQNNTISARAGEKGDLYNSDDKVAKIIDIKSLTQDLETQGKLLEVAVSINPNIVTDITEAIQNTAKKLADDIIAIEGLVQYTNDALVLKQLKDAAQEVKQGGTDKDKFDKNNISANLAENVNQFMELDGPLNRELLTAEQRREQEIENRNVVSRGATDIVRKLNPEFEKEDNNRGTLVYAHSQLIEVLHADADHLHDYTKDAVLRLTELAKILDEKVGNQNSNTINLG